MMQVTKPRTENRSATCLSSPFLTETYIKQAAGRGQKGSGWLVFFFVFFLGGVGWGDCFNQGKEKPEFPVSEPLQVGGSLLPLIQPSVLIHWTVNPLPVIALMGIPLQYSQQHCAPSPSLLLDELKGPLWGHPQNKSFARGRPYYCPGVSLGCQDNIGVKGGQGESSTQGLAVTGTDVSHTVPTTCKALL